MRNVTHLLGAEFLHNLYNRHLPRINAVRFRNTVVFWKDGIANSYAPHDEWNTLEKWFGERFARCDERVIAQVQKLTKKDRSFFHEQFSRIQALTLSELTNEELFLALIDLQDISLGELYSVNLVQIEYALTLAAQKLLRNHTDDDSSARNILAAMLVPNSLTEAQKEDLELLEIVAKGKETNEATLEPSSPIYTLLEGHYEKYAYMHCAYGENPPSWEAYQEKYEQAYATGIQPNLITNNLKEKHQEALTLRKQFDDEKLAILIPLLSDLGVFRDTNKATLGFTIKVRFEILDEIARRGLEKREQLDFYLLSEVGVLLESGERVFPMELTRRKTEGVLLTRREFLQTDDYMNLPQELFGERSDEDMPSELEGTCASPGIVEGTCKVILNKDDADELEDGDIMVAIGTDFDLMDAIQRSSAVITEEGGLLSHASVVCRELGIPCCIGVKDATHILQDNRKIVLDAGQGLISIKEDI